jgi:hypothetical protein
MITSTKLNLPTGKGFDFNFNLVNADFFNQLERKSTVKISDEKSRAKPNQSYTINQFSKNILRSIIVYLQSNEIFALIKSNKIVCEKLFNDQVTRNIQIDAYNSFFMQQFIQPKHEHESNLNSLFSVSTTYSSAFCRNNNGSKVSAQSLSQLCNKQQEIIRENKAVAFTDEESSFKGMDEIYSSMKHLYCDLIAAKKWFNETNEQSFTLMNAMDIDCFLRELFLDPSECENPSYLLP